MDITNQALMLYKKYISISEQYAEVQSVVSDNVRRLCSCGGWKRVTLNRFENCVQRLHGKANMTYHITLYKTALAEVHLRMQ